MPDIPTMAEQGFEAASGSSGEGWTAMWAPAQTPPAEIERMQQALQKILAKPGVRDFLMTRLSVMPDYRDAQQMAQAQRAELAAWAPVIKASGFKPE
jgi:tripartite-type tricarboxylate transporter receptor subunit TctC